MIDTTMGQQVLDWFAQKGISGATVKDFGIYIADDGAVCFPYDDAGVKRRYGVPRGERSFRWESGTAPVLFNRRDLGRGTLFLCEGETDTMRLRQELGEREDVGVIGLPGIETWSEGMANSVLAAAPNRVFVLLDNDSDYRVAGRVDTAWRAIRASLGRTAARVVLPSGVNDLVEFFDSYDLDALRLLVGRADRPAQSRFKPLDVITTPEPPRWVIDGMICQGDLHLLIGEMNAGKSWITMAMTVALTEGWPSFLGHDVIRPGRVLYFDEENPEDMVVERLQRLGLTAKGSENLRYVKDAGIRLDKDPDTVLDEAMDFRPTLIILDSLTRIHTQDENSAGSMAALFNDAIKPLAREADAAVVLIHHVNKSDGSATWKRARGSSDITSFPDAGYDVTMKDDGSIRFKNFKARRKAQSGKMYLSLLDKPDGSIELLSTDYTAAGF